MASVGARQRIVEGAVGMVQLALQRLEAEGVVELDEERKATMVSNLLVILLQRAGDPARRQHRHALPVTAGTVALTAGTGRGRGTR